MQFIIAKKQSHTGFTTKPFNNAEQKYWALKEAIDEDMKDNPNFYDYIVEPEAYKYFSAKAEAIDFTNDEEYDNLQAEFDKWLQHARQKDIGLPSLTDYIIIKTIRNYQAPYYGLDITRMLR